jgi:hypothetical protein
MSVKLWSASWSRLNGECEDAPGEEEDLYNQRRRVNKGKLALGE